MAGTRIIFPQFRDEQSDSRYPFVDTATLRSDSGLDAGKKTFIDAVLHPINGQEGPYISSIFVRLGSVTIWIGDQTNTKTCFATFGTVGAAPAAELPLVDIYGRPAGLLLVNSVEVSKFAGWPQGEHLFRPAATTFVATVVIPAQEPGVRAVLPATEEFLTDDLWLIGDQGVVVRGVSETVVRFDIVGEPLFQRFLCGPLDKFEPPTFVKTINGCPPDEYGNFNITASNLSAKDAALRVYPENNTLRIDLLGAKVL
jgi:hypothetical protein